MPICDGFCWHKDSHTNNGSFILLETGEKFDTERAMKQREVEYGEKKWRCRHENNGQLRVFSDAYNEEKKALELILGKMPDSMIQDIFQCIHHSTLTEKQLAQHIHEYTAGKFYIDEEVFFKNINSEYEGRIVGKEKCAVDSEGNNELYDIEFTNGRCKEVISGVLASNIRRIKETTLAEFVMLIPLVAEKTLGTSFWSLDDILKQQFNIRDKLHSLFTKCSHEKQKSIYATDSYSNEVEFPKNNSSSSNLSVKQRTKLVPNAKDTCRQTTDGRSHEQQRGKGAKRRSTKPLHLKNDASVNCAQKSMYKFLLTSPGTSSPAVLAPSPKATAEKRYEKALARIIKLFPAPEPKEFCHACEFALSTLSENQIESIPYEEIRYAIILQRDKKNEMAISAKMSREERKEFSRLRKKERKKKFGNIDRKLAMLLRKKLDDKSLHDLTPLPKLEAYKLEEHSLYFGTCLFITEFLNVFQSILVPRFIPSAEQFVEALKNDKNSSVYIVQHLSMTIMNTLLQTPEVKKCFVFGIPVSMVPVTVGTLPELIRVILSWYMNDEDKTMHNRDFCASSANSAHEVAFADYGLNIQSKRHKDIFDKLALFGITELSAEEQLEVIKSLIECVQGSSVFRLFLEETVFDQLRIVNAERDRLEMDLLKLEDELRDVPSFSQELDETVTRRQAIEKNKVEKDRKRIIKSIEITKEKLESLLQDEETYLTTSKRMLRLEPLGYDRYHRRYWFFGKSPNRGIYVEKGWFNEFRKEFVENEVSEGVTDPATFHSEVGGETVFVKGTPEKARINGELFDEFENLYSGCTTFPPNNESEEWYKICDEETLRSLMSALSGKGMRESILLENIKNIFTEFNELNKRPECTNAFLRPNDSNVSVVKILQDGIRTFESELRKRRFTRIGDEDDFLNKIEQSESLSQLRKVLLEMCESIPEGDFKKAVAFVFSLKRWKEQVMKATSLSQLNVLLHVLEAQIKWDYSLRGKGCRICNVSRCQDELVVCEKCGGVTHFHCIRPKLTQMPPGGLFVCSNCREEAVSPDVEIKNEGDLERSGSSCDEDDVNDSHSSLEEEDEVELTTLQKELIKYLEPLKRNRQVYALLQKVPVGENKFRSGSVTLNGIFEKILSYTSEYKLRSDLRALFRTAVAFYQCDAAKQRRLCSMKEKLGL